MFPFGSRGVLACAIIYLLSSIADNHLISSLTLFLLTTLYGVSRKPYEFVLEYVASELIRPIFGPSGVSIGQTLP